MKILKLILAVMLLSGVVYAAQQSSLSIRQVRDPVQLREAINANAADVETNRGIVVVTNATVVVAAFTPAYVGQLLYGSASNLLYVAVGATTNDWKQITMTAE